MNILADITKTIGNTPTVRIPLNGTNWTLLLKLEKFNPGQSMKDRMAINMIEQAEKDGVLPPGGTIIESSSGNTATGLAIVAAVRGYKFIAIVDHHAAKEKLDIIRAYGGQTIFVKGKYATDEVAVVEREATALKLASKMKNAFNPRQADNLSNREAYVDSLAKELVEDIREFNVLIGSAGTGGSLCGTAKGVKKRLPNVEVIAVEPMGSTLFNSVGHPYLQSGTGNPVGADIPKNFNYEVIDKNLYASDAEAFNTCRILAKKQGILIGGSTGGAIFKAIEIAKSRKGQGRIVVIAADGGEKYIHTIFNDDWMKENNLNNQKVINYLKETIL